MMNIGNVYALPAVISFFFFAVFSIVVYKKDPKSNINRLSSVLFLLIAMWSFFEFMLRWSTDHQSAFFWAYMIFITIIFIPPITIHLSLIFPWSRKKAPKYIYLFYSLSIILFIFMLDPSFYLSGVEKYYAGYGSLITFFGILLYIYMAFIGIIVIYILIKKLLLL